MSSVGAVYDRPCWVNHEKCAVTDRAYSGEGARGIKPLEGEDGVVSFSWRCAHPIGGKFSSNVEQRRAE